MIYTCTLETPLGVMRAAADERAGPAICGLWFLGQKYFPVEAGTWTESPNLPVFGVMRNWLGDYFAGKGPGEAPRLAPAGSPFRQAVWKLLREIPYGKTTSYGALAGRLGAGGKVPAFQAVGGAVGHNPISIIIPCHRVLGAGGGLTGYAGGLDRKQALLELEAGAQTTL
ncbi:MAG: methylated-DNA--[protein]-cysteine S-methyltransferase [Treponema sp.]|jgi:methylated-DNA-[protein]-cysteine S-methyltransferase|nr:methylated-DNA--[protein]-cysteine S-methyltransferase [Treponema sp.]